MNLLFASRNLVSRVCLAALLLPLSCRQKNTALVKAWMDDAGLKRGAIVSCGPTEGQFGKLDFPLPGMPEVQADFNLAVELLHSFEYDEAEKVFARIIEARPDCVLAYWGVAMSNFHPLWSPPSEAELIKGSKAVERGLSISSSSTRDAGYLNAVAAYYRDWQNTDPHTRCVRFEKAMEALHAAYPADVEATVFYALSLVASADPQDKTYAHQLEAGALLNALYRSHPQHPGIVHYLIHTYDAPELASRALEAARKYAQVAPSSAHALHMPSHIFTRLGLWDECIQSNLHSVESALCYARQSGMEGHWDEELHGRDYLTYAYLQKGDTIHAREQWRIVEGMERVEPMNFKVAYAFAAIPARYCLETGNWTKAASLLLLPQVPWSRFPWQEAIIRFARTMGHARLHQVNDAASEYTHLQRLRDTLLAQKEGYKADEVEIQMLAAQGWIQWARGKKAEALRLMAEAAAKEDSTEKHPVTPGEVLPAREQLADLQRELGMYEDALASYRQVLKKTPKRWNSLRGVALCVSKTSIRK